jgi:hypothetical protein
LASFQSPNSPTDFTDEAKMELGKTLDFPPYLFNEIQIVDTPKSLRTRIDIGSAEGRL